MSRFYETVRRLGANGARSSAHAAVQGQLAQLVRQTHLQTEPQVHLTRGLPMSEERVDAGKRPLAKETAKPASAPGRAIVPVLPTRSSIQGVLQRWMARVVQRLPTPNAEVPREIYERLDASEVQAAAVEELLIKRLEEGEGRTLHLVEKRLAALQDENKRLARKEVRREVAALARRLRIQSAVIGVLSIGIAVAALLVALGVV